MGFRRYELRCLDDYAHRVPYFNEAQLAALKASVAAGNAIYTALSPGCFKVPLTEKIQIKRELEETLPRACVLARELQCPRIIVFSFMKTAGKGVAEAVRLLRKAAEIVASFGLEMAIENEPFFFADTGVRTAALIEKINLPHVGINWDPANAVIAGEAAYPVGYEAVKAHLRNVHVKDSFAVPPDKWENRLLGQGGMNWVGQLAAFLRDRPVEHLTLETHVFPVKEATEENLRRWPSLLAAARLLNENLSVET